MSRLTTDRNDPELGHGGDTEPGGQNKAYLVLDEAELAKGYVRPFRDSYVHSSGDHPCGTTTTMSHAIAATYARNPYFYGFTYCCHCQKHLPVEEFVWARDGERVGS